MIFVDRLPDTDITPDVCIVGAGPVGLALALRAAGHGLKVLVVEAGGVDAPSGSGRADELTLAPSSHAAPETIRASGLGGTSQLWGGRCVRYDDIDFEARSHVAEGRWPISHGELVAHYEDAFAFLGCGPLDPTVPVTGAPSAGEINMATSERWSSHPDIGRYYRQRLHNAPRLRLHTGCRLRACRFDAPSGRIGAVEIECRGSRAVVTASRFVLAAGGLENVRILLMLQQEHPRLFGGDAGPLGRYYSGHLTGYLAAIRFHDPALASALAFQKSTSGHYGRRRLAVSPATQHELSLLNAAFWYDSLSIADPAHASGALSLLYLALERTRLYRRLAQGLAPASTSPAASVARAELDRTSHWSNIRGDHRLVRNTLRLVGHVARHRRDRRLYGLPNPENVYLLRYHAEQAPDRANRVTLARPLGDPDRPALSIEHGFRTQDVRSVVGSHAVLDRWLRDAGTGQLDYLAAMPELEGRVTEQAIDGFHQIGLTRMASSSHAGVVDTDCRTHDISNLFLAGSSVFPTAGQANPTLPAVALALRLADHLAAGAQH
jgi:choline dehydrogenase-like flavoprotein